LLLVAAGSIFTVSVLFFFVPGAMMTLLGRDTDTVNGMVTLGVLFFLVGALVQLLALGRGHMRSEGHRHLVRDAHHAMTHDPRPPVLYLRPFSIDPAAARPQVFSPLSFVARTEEEHLSSALSSIGPLLAIGQPGELPRLGAARLYVSGDWQNTVLRLMTAARLVVLSGGRGEGLLWELRHAVTILPPTRLVVLIPFDPQDYEAFREIARTYFPRPLPDYPLGKPVAQFASKGAIYFGPDWTPHFVRFDARPGTGRRLRRNETFKKAFVRALRPVFDLCDQEAQALWRAAEAGNLRAMRILDAWRAQASRAQEGEAGYRRAVMPGRPDAMWALTEWVQRADRGQETEAWYRRAAETGHPEAMWALIEWLERAGQGQKALWLELFGIEPCGGNTDPPTLASDKAN
jgi:hypothetical protein